MFGLRQRKAPTTPFTHQPGCPIVRADPSVVIDWQEVESGLWKQECACGFEYFREPVADSRVRLDPFDPVNARHLGQCEYVSETDPAVLKVLLKVNDGAGGDYWWVECGGCGTAWAVPHFAVQEVK